MVATSMLLDSPKADRSLFARLTCQKGHTVDITERTTVVLRNIPNKHTQQGLLELFEANGFTKDTLDFVYMPMDFRNKINLGYCFINFVSHANADGFMARFENFNQWGSNSTKLAEVKWCQVQGLAAHIGPFFNAMGSGALRDVMGVRPVRVTCCVGSCDRHITRKRAFRFSPLKSCNLSILLFSNLRLSISP